MRNGTLSVASSPSNARELRHPQTPQTAPETQTVAIKIIRSQIRSFNLEADELLEAVFGDVDELATIQIAGAVQAEISKILELLHSINDEVATGIVRALFHKEMFVSE